MPPYKRVQVISSVQRKLRGVTTLLATDVVKERLARRGLDLDSSKIRDRLDVDGT
jgi:hypothetical protein